MMAINFNLQILGAVALVCVCALGLSLAADHGILQTASGAVSTTVIRPDETKLAAAPGPAPHDDESYPYESRMFSQFIEESYGVCGGGGSPATFYNWMESAYRGSSVKYPGKEGLTLSELLTWERGELASAADMNARAAAQMNFAAWLHKMVKGTIRKFSLDRGFEFCNTVKLGERQCFLQSVLISGMLQRAGMDAGVVMVFKNIAGQETNNGHAVPLLKLANGQDILVDASDPEPFVQQKGLLVRTSDYVYVNPVYDGKQGRILYYTPAWDIRKVETSRVRTLDIGFINSQFWYYRGERTPGGLLSGKTPAGLSLSKKSLAKSVQLCPKNPLAVFMLGRVLAAEGKGKAALGFYRRSVEIYNSFGWVPASPRQAARGGG